MKDTKNNASDLIDRARSELQFGREHFESARTIGDIRYNLGVTSRGVMQGLVAAAEITFGRDSTTSARIKDMQNELESEHLYQDGLLADPSASVNHQDHRTTCRLETQHSATR